MAGNHSQQMACELGMALQPKAKRQCELPHSAGASPLSRTANTANPTSAVHACPVGPFLDSSVCVEEQRLLTSSSEFGQQRKSGASWIIQYLWGHGTHYSLLALQGGGAASVIICAI